MGRGFERHRSNRSELRHTAAPTAAPEHPVLRLQRLVGNATVSSLLSQPTVQRDDDDSDQDSDGAAQSLSTLNTASGDNFQDVGPMVGGGPAPGDVIGTGDMTGAADPITSKSSLNVVGSTSTDDASQTIGPGGSGAPVGPAAATTDTPPDVSLPQNLSSGPQNSDPGGNLGPGGSSDALGPAAAFGPDANVLSSPSRNLRAYYPGMDVRENF